MQWHAKETVPCTTELLLALDEEPHELHSDTTLPGVCVALSIRQRHPFLEEDISKD